jgi:hypothetical protein
LTTNQCYNTVRHWCLNIMTSSVTKPLSITFAVSPPVTRMEHLTLTHAHLLLLCMWKWGNVRSSNRVSGGLNANVWLKGLVQLSTRAYYAETSMTRGKCFNMVPDSNVINYSQALASLQLLQRFCGYFSRSFICYNR